jgi:uncharacterized protein
VRDSEPSPFPLAIALPIIMIIVLNRLFGQRRRDRYRGYRGPVIVPGGWGGRQSGWGARQGGSGGGFGGGGGSFGGGGASGRW